MIGHAEITHSAFKWAAANRLRANATNAEILLWRRLKRLETKGTHFRRQMPIGNFIADFVCPAARLIVEVDGSQHGDAYGLAHDRERTRWLEVEGYRVIRFWNNDIAGHIESVMEAIYDALYGSPSADSRVLKHPRTRSRSN